MKHGHIADAAEKVHHKDWETSSIHTRESSSDGNAFSVNESPGHLHETISAAEYG